MTRTAFWVTYRSFDGAFLLTMALTRRRIVDSWVRARICGNASGIGVVCSSRIRQTYARGGNPNETETQAATDRHADRCAGMDALG